MQRVASIARRVAIVGALFAALAVISPAQTFTRLFSFDGADGSCPQSALVQGTDGQLYGTTSGCLYSGVGAIFKITPAGKLTILYTFCAQSGCTDGINPSAVIQATNGDFYGVTDCGGAYGYGTVFRMTPTGTLITLYNFNPNAQGEDCGTGNAQVPVAGLVQATDGNLYGTTRLGGANNVGTVFKITPGGALTTLYSFCSQSGCADGETPYGGLIQATGGDFYGTTYSGGSWDQGTVFRISLSGTLTTLHTFCIQCGGGGFNSWAGLVQGSDGDFYGTTYYSGGIGGGTIFKITPSGMLTALYKFCSQDACVDGVYPAAGLVQGTDGNFYGTTQSGGISGSGEIFKITPAGAYTPLYSFCPEDGCGYGAFPESGLTQATNGDFYGQTSAGGTSGDGMIFRLSVGLGPFVEPQTSSGKIGSTIKILGTDLTGAISVTFNGMAAEFTVTSPSLIIATVPDGAATGPIRVITPSTTLSSNVSFRVVD